MGLAITLFVVLMGIAVVGMKQDNAAARENSKAE